MSRKICFYELGWWEITDDKLGIVVKDLDGGAGAGGMSAASPKTIFTRPLLVFVFFPRESVECNSP